MDEFLSGLYFVDIECLLWLLRKLWDFGNIVIIVEYNLQVLVVCDYVVEFGLGVGDDGGWVLFEGSFWSLICSDILMGKVLCVGI